MPFAETWAGQLWREGVEPRATLVERYLVGTRRLELGDDLALSVIRWHPGIRAMLSLFRGIHDGRRQAVLRTYLNPDATRSERKFTGPNKAAAIMLDGFDAVSAGLHIAEGLETGIAARLLDMRPCWALGSRGQIKTFPVLGGIEALTICGENDDKSPQAAKPSADDIRECADRWHTAGREAFIDHSIVGQDLADAIAWRAAQ